MKTIFVALFQGAEARSILRTNVYTNLINSDIRVVFFAGSPARADYYRKEFNNRNVIYEVVGNRRSGFLDNFFSRLSFKLLRSETVDLRRKMSFELKAGYISYITDFLLNRILAYSWIRKLIRFLDYFLVRDKTFGEYFNKYHPSAIFLAHLFDDLEIQLLREAKRRNIPTIGFINSWDKLTARNIIRLLPGKLLVFNKIVKKEAETHADIKAQDVVVVGVPGYDWHINYKFLSRGDFFYKKDLDLSKKLIVYAPMGKAFSSSDWDIIDLLRLAINNGRIHNAQLLVRFQPNDFVDEDEIKKRTGLVYDLPGIRFSRERGIDWDMSFNDIKGLTDTLANADVFICYASSMSIDAAIFDKPVINIDFEVREKELMSKSPTYFYQMTHYQNAVKSGGISYSKNESELINQINRYLENPALDREGRQRLVREQCWKLDGKAGERIADVILKLI